MIQSKINNQNLSEINKPLYLKKKFVINFLFGFILADLTTIIKKEYSELLILLICITIIYLVLLSAYEISKKKYFLTLRDGISLGLLSKIILTYILSIFNINSNINVLILSIDFLILRLIAYYLIKLIFNKPKKHNMLIKPLNIWMKIEYYFFILFILINTINNNWTYLININVIFGYLFIPSILIGFIAIFKLRESFN